ncbi:MAG: TIGR03936 family radical SAM-associated protein [Eubacteriales bacterium]|nr:TIGR03936 family radical SAM-associated protein [Eubacteriales bacterium]
MTNIANRPHVKLRVTFSKKGRAAYISHLDLLRTFIRALRRAQIPVKYSEGFNPHAQLTFALPLAVGATSECELVDITLTNPIDVAEAVKNLSKALPEGITVNEAQLVYGSFPEFRMARYTLTIENDSPITDKLKQDIVDVFRLTGVMVEKKTKKKTTMVNILEHIYEFKIEKAEGNILTFNAMLSAGNEFTLKPDLAISGISSACEGFNPVFMGIHRTEILT